jgi:GNAT superfamily N-acetyltransferase
VSLPVRGGEIVTVLFGTEQDVIILPFQPEDQAEVKELILAGLAEHWGRIDPSKNPDLNDIHSSYANATFLVGWMGSRIVGTGALVPRGEDTAEIVRMSVTADMRRKGIASQILRRLCEQARLDGRRRIVLETTETWDGVIEFYKQFGFQVTHHTGGDVYFRMQL